MIPNETIKDILMVIEGLFVLYLTGYSTFIFASIISGTLSLYRNSIMRRIEERLDMDYDIYVSILVPAYNEAVTIVSTIESLLTVKNNKYEIIIIDDGSDDGTADKIRSRFGMHRVQEKWDWKLPTEEILEVYESLSEKVPVYLVIKANGGKSDALNAGINVASYDYFMCVDADSVLEYDSIEKITRPILSRQDVAAVGGLVRISNSCTFQNGKLKQYRIPKKLLPALQVIEYGKSFFASRIMLDEFNGNLIISGAFGLFNKELVLAVGGYETNTVGEDMELVMKLHAFCRSNKIPYVICYESEAVCWTQAPDNIRDFIRQRRRWHIGLMQSMDKYKDMLFSPRYGALGIISYPYFLLYEVASPIVELVGLVITMAAILLGFVNTPFMIAFFVMYTVFGAMLAFAIFLARIYVEHTWIPWYQWFRVFFLCIFEMIMLRPIVSFARMYAIVAAGRLQSHWGKIRREEFRTVEVKD